MKDSLRFIYEQVGMGWKRIQEGQSFEDACKIAQKMKSQFPEKNFCVNSK